MKIGVMVSGQTAQTGGGYTYEDEIVRAVCRRRGETEHDIFLIGYQQNRPPHLDLEDLPWITLHRSKADRRRQKIAKLGRAMKRLMKTRPGIMPLDFHIYPDLHAHPVDLLYYLTPLVRPVADIPYITTVWDLEHRKQPFFPEVSQHGEWHSREKRYREVLARAAYVVACNSTGMKEVVDLYGIYQDRVRAFPQPTPSFALEADSSIPRKESLHHLGIKRDYLFYPAQFWPHKNHLCLLQALKILREKYDYLPQLVLTGSDKRNRSHLENAASIYAQPGQVIFPGFVSREDLVALYRGALALVYSSFFGPENLPPLEAFALGCPVIASRISGHDVQLGSAALLVDPTRPDEWASKIECLRRDSSLRESCILRGKERAALHTSDDFARSLFKLMDEFAAYRQCWPNELALG
jgi:glycosyltransferase involved in cell wall biosynthesis